MVDSIGSVAVATLSALPARSPYPAPFQPGASNANAKPQFAFRADQVKISPEAQRIADLAKNLSDSKSGSAGAAFGRGLQDRVRALFAAGGVSAAAAAPPGDAKPAPAPASSGAAPAAASTAPAQAKPSEAPRSEPAPEQQAASQPAPPSSQPPPSQPEASASPQQASAPPQSAPAARDPHSASEPPAAQGGASGTQSNAQPAAAPPAPKPKGGLLSVFS